MLKWLESNVFWALAVVTALLAFYSAHEDNVLAAFAFLVLFVIVVMAGVYYQNVAFTRALTKEALTEYDRILQQQLKRRGLKVIKGGKDQ